jgi:hypothetical protein
MNLDFGGILKRAWEITWRNKILWLLGILSAIGSGGGFSGGNQFNFNQTGSPNPLPDLQTRFPDLDPNVVTALALGAVCVIILIGIAFWVLSIIGRGALIGGINVADTRSTVSLGEAWRIGTKHFVTVLLIGLAVAILGLLIGVASIVAVASVCLAPLGCVGFLLIAVLSVFTYLAQIAAITENLSVGDAFTRAWQIVKANIASIVVLGLILAVVNGVVGFVVALPLGFTLVPIMAAAIAFGNENAAAGGTGLAIAGLCLVAWIPVLIIVRGIVETWVTSAWLLAYRRLSGQTGAAPLAPMAPMAS